MCSSDLGDILHSDAAKAVAEKDGLGRGENALLLLFFWVPFRFVFWIVFHLGSIDNFCLYVNTTESGFDI